MTYRIGICDDGRSVCAEIEEMVLHYAKKEKLKMNVKSWLTGEALCDYLKQGKPLDILFLDIILCELSGIEVAEYIRSQMDNRRMQIIYISGRSSYALKLFKTQPLDFLIKPVTWNQVEEVLDLAVRILCKDKGKFEFQEGKEHYWVSYGEIMYFESEGRKVHIITPKGDREFYGKLSDIEKNLPDSFLRIHQSYVVNQEYIACYTYEMVRLKNDIELTISKAYRKQVREHILMYS